jgi:tetratricopeptide (TPR) repeat protein
MRYQIFMVGALLVLGCQEPVTNEGALLVPEGDSLYTDLTRSLLDLERQLIEDPANPELYATRATTYIMYDSITNAINDFKRAIALDSTAARYHVALGEVYFFKVRMEEATEQFEIALRVDPNANEARLKLAEIQLLLRNYQRTIDLVNEALRIDPYLAKGYFLKGWTYKELGDTAKAISSYRTAAEQNPEDYDTFMQLGLLHAGKKDPLAEQYFSTAIELRPRSVEAYYGKAMFMQATGNDSLALELYGKIKEIDPRNATAWYNSGYIYMEHLDELDKAIAEFETAATMEPRYYVALYSKGAALERSEQIDDAGRSYEAALKVKPDHEPSANGLSRMVEKGYRATLSNQ